MESIPIVEGTLVSGTPVSPVSALVENRMEEVHALLRQLETATAASQTLPPLFDEAIDARLVQVRLGVAAGLFAALRCQLAAPDGMACRGVATCGVGRRSRGNRPRCRVRDGLARREDACHCRGV